jgi:uncharacterized iron-regulated protein
MILSPKNKRTACRALLLLSLLSLSACGLIDKVRNREPAPLPAPPPAATMYVAPPPAQVAAAAIPNPQVLMLGEVRDNAQGQRERFEDLKRRVDGGWRPVIVMEQFDYDQQDLLDQTQKDCADPDCVIRVMQAPGWTWSFYRPVIDLALTYQLHLVAGGLTRADVSRIVRDGFKTTFDAPTLAAYHLDGTLPPDLYEGQKKETAKDHCNMLPDMMVGGVINGQVARDIWLARTVLAQRNRDVVVLATNVRVRKDIGAPRWIAIAAPGVAVRSEGYEEKDAGVRAGEYDFTHPLPAQKRADACVRVKTKSK